MSGVNISLGILVLVLGIFVIAWVYDEDVGLGHVSLPLEPESSQQSSVALVDSAGVLVGNVSFSITSGSRAAPGSKVSLVTGVNRSDGMMDVYTVVYELVQGNTNQSFLRKDERITREGSFSMPGSVKLPEATPEGNYLLLVNVSTARASASLFAPLSVEREIATPWLEEHLSFFMSLLVAAFIVFAGVYYFVWLRRDLLKKKYEDRQKNSPYPFPDFLTLPQSKFAYVGMVADTEEKAYLDHTQLNRHVLIAGGTGSGKTVASMVMAEELLKRGIPIVVFDPAGQWSGFAKPNDNERMRKRFKKFGLGVPHAYNPRVIPITDATMQLDVHHYLFQKGITVFRLDGLSPGKADAFIEGALGQIYRANLAESGSLKSLVVLDEVHRLLPKYGGRRAYTKLEQAVREFRKWGIGLLMISQVLTDFKGAIRGNIGTEIQVHTRYEGDIKRVRERHGAVVSNLISKLPTGLAMVESANYNKGNPYFIEFRPLLHSPYKLTDKEAKAFLRVEKPVLRADDAQG